MRIVAKFDMLPIPLRSMDWTAFDEDRLDGAPDAGKQSQRQGYGVNRAQAVQELAESACEDYTEQELNEAELDAIRDGDTTTLLFIDAVRTMVGA